MKLEGGSKMVLQHDVQLFGQNSAFEKVLKDKLSHIISISLILGLDNYLYVAVLRNALPLLAHCVCHRKIGLCMRTWKSICLE